MTNQQAGFTLLEVLVAFVIASFLLSVILVGFSQGLTHLAYTDRLSQASLIAQSRLAEFGVVYPLEPAVIEGRDPQATQYSWKITSEPFAWDYQQPLANQGLVMYLVTAEVFWQAAGRQQQYQLSTLKTGSTE